MACQPRHEALAKNSSSQKVVAHMWRGVHLERFALTGKNGRQRIPTSHPVGVFNPPFQKGGLLGMVKGIPNQLADFDVKRDANVATPRLLLINLIVVAFADSHPFIFESPGSGFGSFRDHMKYRLNRSAALGTINHMRFFFDLVCKAGYLSSHLFSFLIHVRGPLSAAF